MKIFSGRGNRKLAEDIAYSLANGSEFYQDFKLGETKTESFPDGTHNCKYLQNIRGEDVFIVQTLCGDDSFSINDYFMEMLTMVDAAKRASAARITIVCPYFPARGDRKVESRTPINAKLWANMISAAGVDRFLTVDIHNSGVLGFFDSVNTDNLYSEVIFLNHILEKYPEEEFVVVAPDVGAMKRSQAAYQILSCHLAICNKQRLSPTEIKGMGLIGDVQGKTALILDDLTETFGTLKNAAEYCRNGGAKKVIECVSHMMVKDPSKIDLTHVDELYYLDTIGVPWEIEIKDKVVDKLSAAPILAQAIRNISEERSVSSLFRVNGKPLQGW